MSDLFKKKAINCETLLSLKMVVVMLKKEHHAGDETSLALQIQAVP